MRLVNSSLQLRTTYSPLPLRPCSPSSSREDHFVALGKSSRRLGDNCSHIHDAIPINALTGPLSRSGAQLPLALSRQRSPEIIAKLA